MRVSLSLTAELCSVQPQSSTAEFRRVKAQSIAAFNCRVVQRLNAGFAEFNRRVVQSSTAEFRRVKAQSIAELQSEFKDINGFRRFDGEKVKNTAKCKEFDEIGAF